MTLNREGWKSNVVIIKVNEIFRRRSSLLTLALSRCKQGLVVRGIPRKCALCAPRRRKGISPNALLTWMEMSLAYRFVQIVYGPQFLALRLPGSWTTRVRTQTGGHVGGRGGHSLAQTGAISVVVYSEFEYIFVSSSCMSTVDGKPYADCLLDSRYAPIKCLQHLQMER